MDFERLTVVIRRLALEAGDRIMEIYGDPEFEVRAKSDASPVTAADEAADRLISEGLAEAYPQMALVTEEQSDSHAQDVTTFLIVDPLDGTKEFVQRRGDFTVNIAYVEDGIPLRGVVYAPAVGRLFYTLADGRSVEEKGRFDKDRIGEQVPLSVSVPDNRALMVVASKSPVFASAHSSGTPPTPLSKGEFGKTVKSMFPTISVVSKYLNQSAPTLFFSSSSLMFLYFIFNLGSSISGSVYTLMPTPNY